MLLPPLAMAAVRTVLPLTGLAAVAAETAFVAGSIFGALPLAIAIFPQESTRSVFAAHTQCTSAVSGSGQGCCSVAAGLGLGLGLGTARFVRPSPGPNPPPQPWP